MKKALKFIGIIMVAIVGVLLLGAIYINASDIPSYPTTDLEYHISSSSESIERGQKLTMMLCVNCHFDVSSGKLSGVEMKDAPPEFGKIYAPNITQDKIHGIGTWTDAELLYLLRTGIKKNGQFAPPYMVKMPLMADEDMNAIISFLKSDHILVTPDDKPDQPSDPSFLTKALCRIAFKPLPFPAEKIAMPDTTDIIELGSYLAKNLDCYACHSADFKTNNYLEPSKSQGYFGGGNKPLDRMGRVVLTSNLTPDLETGIGKWTKEEFVQATKFGIKNNGIPLRYPMVPFSLLTDYEAGAIYEYLQTIPAINNKVERIAYD